MNHLGVNNFRYPALIPHTDCQKFKMCIERENVIVFSWNKKQLAVSVTEDVN